MLYSHYHNVLWEVRKMLKNNRILINSNLVNELDDRVAAKIYGGHDTSNSKVCSGFVQGNFRDTIIVSSNWTSGTCQSWMRSIGADSYQLGCVFDNAFSWGNVNGGTPNPNCGW